MDHQELFNRLKHARNKLHVKSWLIANAHDDQTLAPEMVAAEFGFPEHPEELLALCNIHAANESLPAFTKAVDEYYANNAAV